MEDKFTFKSEWATASIFIGGIIFFVILGCAGSIIGITLMVVYLVIWIVLAIFLDRIPGRFRADEISVTFRLPFKRINIPYAAIKDVEVTREYVHPQLRGEQGRYVETIKFICESGEYSFRAFIDIDHEAIAGAPEILAKQFKRSTFSRLKEYIGAQRCA